MKRLVVFCGFALVVPVSVAGQGVRFAVSFSEELSAERDSLDGRLLLMISNDPGKEPRFQISDSPTTQVIFGIDVDALAPGEDAIFDAGVLGYPIDSLNDIPSGRYWVQALLHEYETFHRADGHVVKLPMDRGEGQHWNRAPGNLYNEPVEVRIDAGKDETIAIVMDRVIPPIADPPTTNYVKHVKIQSKLLTEFWGRPMYLGAHVLVPEGFDEHPEARYPLMVFHGHFPYTFGGWREEPPDPNLAPEHSARFDLDGYNRIVQEEAYSFYKEWTGPDYPRVLVIQIQHANPYYDDSYAVNSANLGPYGDAITYELIPHIEKEFRGIGEGWARFLYGGSTGGWEALGVQVMYPDDYNGCFAACPDPIDFRAYTVVNLYEDKNAYYPTSAWKKTPRPGRRNHLGQVGTTLEQMNRRELVLGSKSRSGQQWDIWEAVYSPVGADGYPMRLWDKLTGEIDEEVAQHWRENYDLSYIMQRDWATLGPKLEGKVHIYVGDMDNYYLNNAVYLTEEFLESTTNPYYGGDVDYGDRAEHCWNGDPTRPNALSRLRYNQMFIPMAVERMDKSAPEGADLTSWRY
ncbi:MAG: alpha/beta hydrolase-fold protein [Acidobacteriota bacterium]|nr:MAG: alpha/beta hydrolase-fold protein [Acidobacteriota bacterium]